MIKEEERDKTRKNNLVFVEEMNPRTMTMGQGVVVIAVGVWASNGVWIGGPTRRINGG